MSKVFFVAIFSFFMCLSAQGQTQTCREGMVPVENGLLQAAITNLLKSNADIQIDKITQTDSACEYMPYSVKAFSGTLRKDYLSKNIKGFEMVTAARKSDDGIYLTVERYVLKSKKTTQRLEDALKQHESRRLAVKSNTYYGYFIFENSVIFMATPAPAYEETVLWFKEIERDFRAAAQVKQ